MNWNISSDKTYISTVLNVEVDQEQIAFVEKIAEREKFEYHDYGSPGNLLEIHMEEGWDEFGVTSELEQDFQNFLEEELQKRHIDHIIFYNSGGFYQWPPEHLAQVWTISK